MYKRRINKNQIELFKKQLIKGKVKIPKKAPLHYCTTYEYNSKIFKSSWELAYFVYCIENNIKQKKFNKDFVENNKDILDKSISYIYNKYGNKFFENHKIKNPTHFEGKRKIIPIQSIKEIHKVKYAKFSYNCEDCGKFVITGYKILKHFNNLKCKNCRKCLDKVED